MRISIKCNRDKWFFIGAVAVFSVLFSEFILLGLYVTFGDVIFTASNIFLLAAIVPILVSLPSCYFMADMALKLTGSHELLNRLAHTDSLTGLINRRSFFDRAESFLDEAQADGSVLSLLVIDADYFKQLNDTYGHATGDAALQFITEQLLGCVRKTDVVCRLGGEEFAVLLPDLSEAEAGRLADRILKAIASRPMVWEGRIIEMSVSCGVADTGVGYDMTALFKAADDALYAAKHNGRNLSVRYTSMPADRQPSGDHRAV